MLMRLAIGVLQLVASSFSFDTTSITNTPETKKCFTCSVFTFIDNRLLCTNPGTCYSDYCYSCECFSGSSEEVVWIKDVCQQIYARIGLRFFKELEKSVNFTYIMGKSFAALSLSIEEDQNLVYFLGYLMLQGWQTLFWPKRPFDYMPFRG